MFTEGCCQCVANVLLMCLPSNEGDRQAGKQADREGRTGREGKEGREGGLVGGRKIEKRAQSRLNER